MSFASWIRFGALAVGCASLVWAVGGVAPALAVEPRAAFAAAYGAVTLEILALAWLLPQGRRGWLAVLPAAPALIWLANLPATPTSAALLTLALGASVTLVGGAIGMAIERPAHLSAVGLVSAIADLWSVLDPGAPSARLAERALSEPEKLTPFALPFPLLGTPLIPAVIGAGDVLFVALYVAAFRTHGLPVGRLFGALALAFAVGLAVLLATLAPIPLLPLLAAAVIACEPAARALERREWRMVSSVCALMLAAIALRALR